MITAISPAMYAAKGISFTGIQKSQVQQQSQAAKNNPSFGMDESYANTLKLLGEIVLTLALFLGVGYYVFEQLFVPPSPERANALSDAAKECAKCIKH